MSAFTPKLYLKSNCPFCFKVIMFLTETQQMDQVDIIRIEGNDESEMNLYRQQLAALTGAKASFPTAELTENEYVTDSDAIVAFFAERAGINIDQAEGYQFYLNGLFPTYIARFKELKALQAQLEA